MAGRKVALIGHSGAGKSACLVELKGNLDMAEMDRTLGVGKSPTIREATKWMIEDTSEQDILAISVHEQMLSEMAQAKEKGDNKELFSRVFFVYLYSSKEKLRERLEEQRDKHIRDQDNVEATLNSYERLDQIFRKIANYTVDTADKDIPQVVEIIKALHSNLRA